MAISLVLHAQQDTQEILLADGVKTISIHTDEVYKITIKTSSSRKLVLKTHSEGEYYNQIKLNTKLVDEKLHIKAVYPEILTGGYDKLSAHKVFAFEVELLMPQNLEIDIRSNIASVEAIGSFETFRADLKQGYCDLRKFSGNAVVNTFQGNITVETHSGKIEAHSRNGTISLPEFLPGGNTLKLTSIDGNIKVRKTK